jgi:calcium-dependent protein kinase
MYRPTCSEILQHPWLKQEGHGMDRPLDNVVLTRMQKFAAMNKLKKTALMVVGSCLSAEEIAGMKRLFKTIDADGSGTITVKELQVQNSLENEMGIITSKARLAPSCLDHLHPCML